MPEKKSICPPLRRLARMAWRAIAPAAALATMFACTNETAGVPKATAPIPVKVAAVRAETIPIRMELPGMVKSVRSIQIVPQVAGQLVARGFTAGTLVEKGDLLYRIDPRPFQARLNAARARLEEGTAQADYWRVETERTRKLAAQGLGTQEQYDKAREQLAQARSAVAEAEADVASARLDLGYARIEAPFSGYIEQTLVHVGSQVSARETLMTTLLQTDPVHIEIALGRGQLAAMQRLQAQGVAPERLTDLAVRVRLGDGSFFPRKGRLDFIASRVDPDTDTLLVRAELPNPADTPAAKMLIAGQYVLAVVEVGERPDALLIPKASLLETQAGRHVYLVDRHNKVQKRAVAIGAPYAGDWVVEKGLKKGETLVVSGLQRLRPGVEVEPIPSGARHEKGR